jgi:hypothetical protein
VSWPSGTRLLAMATALCYVYFLYVAMLDVVAFLLQIVALNLSGGVGA